MDDLKVSHLNSSEITKFACYLQSIYGDKLTVKRGKIHDYMGMDLDYSEKGTIKVSMIKCVGKILRAFPEEIKATSTMLSADHLFQIRD